MLTKRVGEASAGIVARNTKRVELGLYYPSSDIILTHLQRFRRSDSKIRPFDEQSLQLLYHVQSHQA
jgi:hypothetical protein